MRLVLLLGTDVDGPPERAMDGEVLICDVCTLTALTGQQWYRRVRVRVVLHIDSLDGVEHLHI